MADVVELKELPDDIGAGYLRYTSTLRQRQQGRKFAKGGYVDGVKLFRETANVIAIKANVFRSQLRNADQHRTYISVDTKQKIVTEAFCGCKGGISGECAHIMAVLLKLEDWILEGYKEVPAQQACTSTPQQWDKPRGSRIHPEPVSTMVIAKPGTMNRKRKPLIADIDDNRKIQIQQSDIEFLNSLSNCPLSYLANMPDQMIQTDQVSNYIGSALSYHVPLIKAAEVPGLQQTDCGQLNFPHPPEFELPALITGNSDKWGSLAVSEAEAIQIERNSRDQATSALWHKERKMRITASNFGRFLLRKAPITEKFLNNIFESRQFSSAATTYGTNSEKIAKNMYRKKTKNHVHDCGLLVNPKFPFIGASPDAKICENGQSGILEVKSPFSIRDWTIAEALETYEKKDRLFLTKVGDLIQLKRNHIYWYQVQGQLLVSGAKYCDFVTYTKNDLLVERIVPDNAVMINILEKLYDVFINHVSPKLEK